MVEPRQYDQSCAPTRQWRKRGAQAHGIGRSRGGLTTKVHLMIDALALPIGFELSEGQRHDSQPAPTMIDRYRPRCLLADKAYDSDALRAQLEELGNEPKFFWSAIDVRGAPSIEFYIVAVIMDR